MKRLFQLLLLPLALQVQAQESFKIEDTAYLPKQTETYSPIRQVGFAVVTPTNYTTSKKYKTYFIVHGNGERWDARLTDLRNLVLGYGTPRVYPFPPGDILKAINDSQCIAVFPNWKIGMSPDDVNFVIDDVTKRYSVDPSKLVLAGFSAGGGIVSRYISSSKANADRLALAVLAAPVNSISNYTYIKQSRLPVVIITAEKDLQVSPENAETIYKGIVGTGTDIKPYLIKVPGEGHGGLNEIFRYKHSSVPQSLYSYLSMVSNAVRIQYPAATGGGTIEPVPTDPEQSTGVNPAFNITNGQVVTTNTLQLDASTSTGATEYYWEVNRTAYPWVGHVIQGGTVGGPKKTVTGLQNGTYTIRLTVNKNVQSDLRSFTVVIGGTAPVKKLAGFDNLTITYDDGTTEPGTATLKGGVWVVKNAAGNPVQY